jgi:hypothetical protein
MEATTVVFDTGIRVSRPGELAAAIGAMTGGSVYYHFLEARRRSPFGKDDFTAWLIENDADGMNRKYVDALARIDFYFHTLVHLRGELIKVLSALEDTK